jgi:hypothetical protein
VIAVQPIENNKPRGSGTCIVIRAGGSVGKNSAYSWVQLDERALIGYEDDRVDHQLGAAPTGSEYCIQIGERLPRLVRERCAGGFTTRGFDARLARDEEEATSADGLGIRPDLRRAGPIRSRPDGSSIVLLRG